MMSRYWLAASIAFLSLGLYWITLAQGVIWGDSAKLTLYGLEQQPNWDLISGHPLHTLLLDLISSILPFESYAKSANFVSALFAALAVFFTFLTVERLTRSTLAALIGAASLAVSHTFWTFAVVAESYSLIVVIASLVLYLLAIAENRGNCCLLYFMAGVFSALSTLANLLFVFAFPGYVYVAYRKGLVSMLSLILGGTIGVLIVGFLLYVYWDISDVFRLVISQGEAFIQTDQFVRELLLGLVYSGYQFPSLAFIFLLVYLVKGKKNHFEIGMLLSVLGVFIFAATYQYQRHFVFLIMAYFHIAVLIGLAFYRIQGLCDLKRMVLPSVIVGPVALYLIAPVLLGGFNLLQVRPLPGRDAAYFFSPWKQNVREPEIWAKQFLSELDENSVIYADFTMARVIQYTQRVYLHEYAKVVEIDRWIFSEGGWLAYKNDICKKLESAHRVYIAQHFDPYYRSESLFKLFNTRLYSTGFEILSPRAPGSCDYR